MSRSKKILTNYHSHSLYCQTDVPVWKTLYGFALSEDLLRMKAFSSHAPLPFFLRHGPWSGTV